MSLDSNYHPFPHLKKKVSHLCSYEQDQSCSEMCIVCDNSRMRWHVQCWNHVKNVKSAADFKSILICISTKSEFNFHSTKVTLWVTIMLEYTWKSQVETMWKITSGLSHFGTSESSKNQPPYRKKENEQVLRSASQ